jgi:GNAT superfamily N-acetyltransferase
MAVATGTDLYERGTATLLASWEAYARGATAASVQRLPGVTAAVFPDEPERGIYNNAVLDQGLAAGRRAEAIAVMEAAYAASGVARFAAWVHESDAVMRRTLEGRGYVVDTTTRAMGMRLDEIRRPRPALDLATPVWAEYLGLFGLPDGLLAAADHDAFHLRIARLGAESVAAALAFDGDGDCGIYNVETLEHARRRGLGTALTALQVHDARARGCETASLQATEIAERVYRAVGFRDLGVIVEYVPGR